MSKKPSFVGVSGFQFFLSNICRIFTFGVLAGVVAGFLALVRMADFV